MVAEPVRVRPGSTNSVRYRRAMMLLASAGRNRVPVIAQLVQADEDTVRDVIHRFNEIGLDQLGDHRHGLRQSGLQVRKTRNLRGLRSLLVGEFRVQREGAAGLFCPLPRRSGTVSCLLPRVPVPPRPQEGADNAPFFNARAGVGLNLLQAASCPGSGSRGQRGPA
ncbi:helix-turn-helix domain-containing protein [Streptomyces sp. NPDC059668]|uniref:helix-turn-helix domain-containing protein n=1 Tax=Streptomyces sp. NPDC059668 TaxID=3346900 RepID=UPI0036B7BA20